jgi:NAD(P)-dependent dehydrogenase (short-subunit alcohol dehydrogenase family)
MTKPVLILGARGGIGESLALRLADKGHDLVLTSRHPDSLNHLPGRKFAYDVLEPNRAQDLIDFTDQGEGIAGIVYAVGSIALKPLKDARDEDFIASYELNVMGILRVLRAAEKSLRAAKGSVILFSTIAVAQGFTNHTVISTAKGAIEGLTRALAAEWAPDVRVNAIAPSLTQTELAKSLTASDQMAQAIAALHPIPRLGIAADHAAMAEFLLSPDAAWITGQVMHIDGGRSVLRVKG